jgi:D-tyrosyl-tRNA(Tyr) deacylase
MKAVLQRAASARVTVEGREVGAISRGILVLVGVEPGDGPADVEYVARKVRELRIFDDGAGRMNLSVLEIGGGVLAVSQFTLLADCRRGRRPSFDAAAAPAEARAVYDALVERLERDGVVVATGEFQARMQVSLVNDGPVTLLLDSRRRE